MSLPPSDMQAAHDEAVIRPRFTRGDWVRVGVLMLAFSAAYLLIDIALDPALLPHAARAGRLLMLLLLVGIGFGIGFSIVVEIEAKRPRVERTLNFLSILLLGPMLPIWAIAWLDPYLPNLRYGTLGATGVGVADIGFIPCVLSLLYGLFAARKRHETEAAYAARGVPAREQVVGFEPLVRAATVIWLLVVTSASVYGTWLALTNASDGATLVRSLAIVGGTFVVVVVPFFWLYSRTRRYAHQTGDAALLASTTVASAKRAAAQRIVVPPDERPRWGINLLVGLGLVAVSMLTVTVLDFHYVQSANVNGTPGWLIDGVLSLFPAFFSWMGLHRASARRYQSERFQRLLVAAAIFVVAGDAMLIDVMPPRYAIVPPLGLLAIAVLCSTVGALICRSLLLHPMWESNAELNVAIPPLPAASHGALVAGGQKRPRAAPYFVLLLPLLFVVEHLLVYGDASMRSDWERLAFSTVMPSVVGALASVVNTDMPQRQVARRPIKKGS